MRVLLLTAAILCSGAALQPVTRVATTVEALTGAAVFYHGKLVVVEHAVADEAGLTRLANTLKPVFVFWKDRPSGDRGEIRGEFWDLGRIEPGDSRFAGQDFTQLLEVASQGRWPGRDQVYVLLGATMIPWSPPRAPTVRAIAMRPDDYEGREVRVIGRFKGRNLYGDLPHALGKSKWDFVLQSADGAVWVTGLRPRGKGFDLDPTARVDTGRWVEVTGVVERMGNLVYISADAIQIADEPAETPVEIVVRERPRLPQPEVIFSAPIEAEEDVERSVLVRVQFSRDVDPNTLSGRVRVAYVAPPGVAAGEMPKPPEFTVSYNDAAHAIEIKFAEPLERFQRVKVDLLEGVTALDGQTVKPWSLTFTTGSS